MEHHRLDPYPMPKDKTPLCINEPWLIDKSLLEYPPRREPDEKEDNVRIYVPMDLNRAAILRRLDRVIAHYGEDGITQEQEQAYKEYLCSERELLEAAEKMLLENDSMASERFIPKTLLVNRDGSIAIMCDDEDEPDEGIAVCLMPEMQIMSQDDYL